MSIINTHENFDNPFRKNSCEAGVEVYGDWVMAWGGKTRDKGSIYKNLLDRRWFDIFLWQHNFQNLEEAWVKANGFYMIDHNI